MDWTIIQHEGAYEMEVSVKNNDTGHEATATTVFTFTSLVIGDTPVITPTANPLVFIYSAAPAILQAG